MFKIQVTPKCTICGLVYPLYPGDDLPSMVGFETQDGNIINVCRACLSDKYKLKAYLNKHYGEKEGP